MPLLRMSPLPTIAHAPCMFLLTCVVSSYLPIHHSCLEELKADEGAKAVAIRHLRAQSFEAKGGGRYVSARAFYHMYVNQLGGARTCEVVIRRTRRKVVAELSLYTLASANDSRPLKGYADQSKPTTRTA